ncbi:MAG: CDP-alcohol phosphatidyltransferase family protein [Prolixibacteraceae bacterium]
MNKVEVAINNEVVKAITKGRERTNILRTVEQKSIVYLVQRIPSWLSSNMLTAIGLFGNLIVFLSFLLGAYVNNYFLLLNVFGFIISWFGDSLDGRIAFYRKIPRKWYGFTLDLTVDWIGTIFIGLGFMIYVSSPWTLIGYAFIVLYGWAMITAILRYKITGKYSIDSGLLGPTEVRVIISSIMILELLVNGSIVYCGVLVSLVLLITNIIDFRKLLVLADDRDTLERQN